MDLSEQEEENQEMPDFNPEDEEAEEEGQEQDQESPQESRPPRETRKDKDLNTFLNSMDKYAPIVLSTFLTRAYH